MTSHTGVDNLGFQDDAEHRLCRVPSKRAQIFVQKEKYRAQNYFDFNSTNDWDFPENPTNANTTYNHSLPKGRRRRQPMMTSRSATNLDIMDSHAGSTLLDASPVRAHARSWNETPGSGSGKTDLLTPQSALSLSRDPSHRKSSLPPEFGSRRTLNRSPTVVRKGSYDPTLERKGSYTLSISRKGSVEGGLDRKGSLRAPDLILETTHPRIAENATHAKGMTLPKIKDPQVARIKPKLERTGSRMENPRVLEKRLAAFVRQISRQQSYAMDARGPEAPAEPEIVITGTEDEKPAKSYFDLALFTCACCFSPLGLIAVVCSVLSRNAHSDGQYDKSYKYSSAACGLSICGILLTIAIIVIVLLVKAYPQLDLGDYYYWDLTTPASVDESSQSSSVINE